MAKIQSSDVASKPVRGGRKSANVKGAIGHALAAQIISEAQEEGQRVLRQRQSRKETLRNLMGFRDDAEHIAFRGDLSAKLEEIKKEAEAAKITLNAYTDANPIAGSVRAECSLWRKMSEAVASGFTGGKVDLDKPWPDISKAATEHLAAKATNGTGGTQVADSKKRKAGRQPTPLLDKAKQWAKANLIDEKTSAPKDNRNLAEVVAVLCSSATVDELSEVIARLVTLREMKAKATEDVLKKASDGSKNAPKVEGVTTTSNGATVTHRKAAATSDLNADKLIGDAAKAQAKGEKRKSRAVKA